MVWMNRLSWLMLDDSVETVLRVGSVFDDTSATVRLDQTVAAANDVADTLLVLRLEVAGLRAVDAVLEAVTRLSVVAMGVVVDVGDVVLAHVVVFAG